MARLRINQGLNLTLDATSTDFQVKSLAGSNNTNLLINGRNFGVEVRIDEDNTGGDLFRVTQGPNGANTLFSVDSGGYTSVNGNVGIGVTAPTERVETDGNVKAVRFISTAATGVPPLQVSSTTKVDNLNADLLDGYDSTDFPRKAENAVISGIWNFSTIGINKPNPEYRLVVEEASKPIATAIRKINSDNGGGPLSGPTLLVENTYGNHSWGNLAEFRIGDNGGADPPNITFTAGWASTGWAVGMAGINDADFGIASNRGWRFGSFGTVQLRVKPDGQLITSGTITPGVSSGFAGHINGSEPIKFSNGPDAQEIYVRKVRASASWATNDANDPGDGGGFFSGNLLVGGQIRFGDKRTINVYVDHGGDPNTRYYYLGRVHTGAGILKVQGIMGGHTPDQGRANVDVQFSARDGFRIDGEVIGKLGSADIWVYAPRGDSYIYLYLVTNTWALVNLELSAVGPASIGFDGTFSYSAPVYGNNSLPSYKLSTDVWNVLRYTSERDAGLIPVSYSLGPGVFVSGSFSLVARAFAMGPFALIIINPDAWSASSGFAGEGTIILSMPFTRLRNALALDSPKTLGVISAMLTTHATDASIFNDNEYHYYTSYHDFASDSWGIQVHRARFSGNDSPNLLHAWILARFD